MNGGEVRGTSFCPAGRLEVAGYHRRQVDDLLRRVAADLDAGGSARPLIENATFQRRRYRPRYDIEAVDWFLGQFLLPPGHCELDGIADDPWGDLPVARLTQGTFEKYLFSLECESAWRDFGQLPGTHLWWGKATKGLTELRTAEQHTLASARGSSREAFRAGGRSFTLQRTSAAESLSPAVTELLTRAGQDDYGHYAENTRTRNIMTKLRLWPGQNIQELVDETGTPILYTAGDHFNWRACACIMFPDQRWLRFLVRGTLRTNAIMTAVDQAGSRVARYRFIDKSGQPKKLWSPSSVEIIVHPGRKLTDELALALALSADWLGPYFERPRGGG